ncbi:MAG: hypothetical protein HYZ74_00320 [Elusimicrobia bacterium]|nr:hypothetical protein [Elusimicrobiota bacterium]
MRTFLVALLSCTPAWGAPPLARLPVPAPLPSSLLPASAVSVPLTGAPLIPVFEARTPVSPRALSALPSRSAAYTEESLALSQLRREAAHAVQYAHAEIPVLDYRRGAYNEERAREFMERDFVFSESARRTGQELLSLLVTPAALPLDSVPNPARHDFSLFGKSAAQIREALSGTGIPVYRYEDALKEAFLKGLIYRLADAATAATYQGVPHMVRLAFGLEPAAPQAPAAPTGPTAFSRALAGLVRQAHDLPARDELFEFTAQAAAAAIQAGRLSGQDLPDSFQRRSDALGFDVPALADALATLRESARDTAWDARAAALLEAAAAEGLLD